MLLLTLYNLDSNLFDVIKKNTFVLQNIFFVFHMVNMIFLKRCV